MNPNLAWPLSIIRFGNYNGVSSNSLGFKINSCHSRINLFQYLLLSTASYYSRLGRATVVRLRANFLKAPISERCVPTEFSKASFINIYISDNPFPIIFLLSPARLDYLTFLLAVTTHKNPCASNPLGFYSTHLFLKVFLSQYIFNSR